VDDGVEHASTRTQSPRHGGTLGSVNPYKPPAAAASPPPRPGAPKAALTTGVQAVAVAEIFFGGMGLLSAPVTLALRDLAHDPVSRRIQQITWEGSLGAWTRTSLVVGTILAGVMLASGIGILKRRAWGRRAGLAYAVSSILMQVVGQAITFTVLFPALDALAEQYAYDRAASAALMGGRIGGIAGALFGLTVPITLLVMLTRPGVKAQLTE
jgi:hypothetical protein